MSMIEVKTSELAGAQLDWAVAKASGKEPVLWDVCCGSGVFTGNPGEPPECCCNPLIELSVDNAKWAPSADWSQGGPLIDKHQIEFRYVSDNILRAVLATGAAFIPTPYGTGETHLIAACRAIVASKLGDTVQIPQELMP